MLIPALDLIDGKVVRLEKGDFSKQTTFHDDPVAVARQYQSEGAELLHLVDLDGARDPAKRQLELITRITKEAGLKIQTGGGVRTKDDVQQMLDAGVSRVVVGSKAVDEPEDVIGWLEEFGRESITLALDVNIDAGGRRWLATQGWQKESKTQLDSLLDHFGERRVHHVLCTDISRDGMMKGPNTAMYAMLKQKYPAIRWQASGGVSSLKDLERLKAASCDSAILGKALLTGAFTLKNAISTWESSF